MIDITSFITRGVASAKEADTNNAEIDAVIDDVSKQLEAFTDGAVTLATRQITPLDDEVTDAFLGGASYSKRTLILKGNGIERRIGRLGRSELGYPCSVYFDDQVINASDREALALALGDLFATHHTGTILFSMMSPK